MEDRLKRMKETSFLNHIHFDRAVQNEVYDKLSSHPPKRTRWLMGLLSTAVCLGMLAIALFYVVPNNLFQNHDNTSHLKEVKDVRNVKNVKTIQTYLEKEFTGPSEELKKILKNPFAENGKTLTQYIDENYKDLISENNYQTFINTNEFLFWLHYADMSGYQLKPKKIEIQKNDNYNGYTFKVEVEYSKDGKAGTATVTGYINLNDKGKISAIRDINDKELMQNIMPPPPKKE